jgi:hypothetical protein
LRLATGSERLRLRGYHGRFVGAFANTTTGAGWPQPLTAERRSRPGFKKRRLLLAVVLAMPPSSTWPRFRLEGRLEQLLAEGNSLGLRVHLGALRCWPRSPQSGAEPLRLDHLQAALCGRAESGVLTGAGAAPGALGPNRKSAMLTQLAEIDLRQPLRPIYVDERYSRLSVLARWGYCPLGVIHFGCQPGMRLVSANS